MERNLSPLSADDDDNSMPGVIRQPRSDRNMRYANSRTNANDILECSASREWVGSYIENLF